LREGRLSENPAVENAFSSKSGPWLDVRFERSPVNFVDAQNLSFSSAVKLKDRLGNQPSQAADIPLLDHFMKNCK
jgi:hypothetical protein